MVPPAEPETGTKLRWSWWNLLLLVPFLMLFTPLFNSIEPRLFGMPYFYWWQFAWVPIAVICVVIVYVKTRDDPPQPVHRDEPREGAVP